MGYPDIPSTASDISTTAPLTFMQRLRLLVDCLPFLFFLVVTLLYVTVLTGVFGTPNLALLAFLGLVLLVTGFTAVQRLRDLLPGMATVQNDLLEKSWRPRYGNGRRRCYGEFAQLGKLTLVNRVYYQHPAGQRYRVYYSPVSRIVWDLQPVA
ncbi:MAG: hypothetical protein KF716_29400 [Anaerolineae bacterium]|nr:hypothetical protein [Anaerolineae bacterium]